MNSRAQREAFEAERILAHAEDELRKLEDAHRNRLLTAYWEIGVRRRQAKEARAKAQAEADAGKGPAVSAIVLSSDDVADITANMAELYAPTVPAIPKGRTFEIDARYDIVELTKYGGVRISGLPPPTPFDR